MNIIAVCICLNMKDHSYSEGANRNTAIIIPQFQLNDELSSGTAVTCVAS